MSKSKLIICLKLIFVIAIASTLFSCNSQGVNLETLDPNLYDQSWLTGQPCGAPCWYGLEPGVSSREDSISKVKQLPFIGGNDGASEETFLCKEPRDSDCIFMIFENDTNGPLEDLYVIPNYQITFEQAVEKLGSPDGFSILPMYADAAGCRLQAIWKNKRLVLQYQTGVIHIFYFGLNRDLCDNTGKRPLPKGILVQEVEIMLPSEIESMTQANPTLANPAPFVPWKGFAN